MPYDKGDFTQQGYDGKVSGGLLLNNKRDVDVLASTNEDDSTLGLLAVTIEDHLNDLHYVVLGENLEAGEVYEIGAGGGVSNPVIEITVINNSGVVTGFYLYVMGENNMLNGVQFGFANGETEVVNAIVIPESTGGPEGPFTYKIGLWHSERTKTASNEVNCTYDSADDEIELTDPTQNGSITITLS